MTSLASLLVLGGMVGMRHAFEADHIAAVSNIVAGDARKGRALAHGLSWGLGHTITLLLFSGAAMAVGRSIPGQVEDRFEIAVGVMLVGLGLHLLWRIHRDRVHFHGHIHAGHGAHFHGHSHRNDAADHARSPHDHSHHFSPRAMVVGMIHGLAGSAALLVLAASQIDSVAHGVIYIAVFGVGSMIGMGLLSVAISVPLRLAERRLNSLSRALQVILACATISIGASTVVRLA